MRRILLSLLCSLASCSFARAGLIPTPDLARLLNADTVILVAAKDLTFAQSEGTPNMVARNVRSLKGEANKEVTFLTDLPPIPNCEYHLLFLSREASGLHAVGSGSMTGLNQKIPMIDGSVMEPDNFYRFLLAIFLNEKKLSCALLDGLLLSKAPSENLRGLTPQMIGYLKADTHPLAILAAVSIVLHGDGIGALKLFPLPDFADVLRNGSHDMFEGEYGADLISSVTTWIRKNAGRENYLILSQFARQQSKEMRARTLIAISKFARPENIQNVIAMFDQDLDMNVKYSCVQNLCHAFGTSVPAIDNFEAHSDEMTEFWNQRIKTFKNTGK